MGRLPSLLILVLLSSPLVRAQTADYNTDADEEGVLSTFSKPADEAPAPVVAAPAPSPAVPRGDSYCSEGASDVQETCQRINSIRVRSSLTPLTLDATLNAVAADFAQRLYAYNHGTGVLLDHNLNGWTLDYRLQRFGVDVNRLRGENIAAGQGSPAEVVQDWMNSQGHRENILLGGFQHSGLGHYGHFWVQIFLD